MTRFLVLMMVLTGLAACTVRSPADPVVLSHGFAVAGGTFTSGGGMSVAADVRNIDGKTGVCGIWAESTNQSVMTKGRAKYVLGPSAVVLGREALLTGLDFLAKVEPAAEYTGTMANCVVLARDWTASDADKAVQIVMPRQVVYEDLDGLGAFIVYFNPTGPAAHPDDPLPWD